MATLNAAEFTQTVRCLADDIGLQRLRDKLVRLNALVARGRAPSADALADQLYMLTGGLRRQVPATIVWGYACVLGMIWTAAKIFRVGVLMYGKPPTPVQLLKWLRYT